MAKKAAVIMPQTREILAQMGEQIRLARLRRKLSLELVAERAGISRGGMPDGRNRVCYSDRGWICR